MRTRFYDGSMSYYNENWLRIDEVKVYDGTVRSIKEEKFLNETLPTLFPGYSVEYYRLCSDRQIGNLDLKWESNNCRDKPITDISEYQTNELLIMLVGSDYTKIRDTLPVANKIRSIRTFPSFTYRAPMFALNRNVCECGNAVITRFIVEDNEFCVTLWTNDLKKDFGFRLAYDYEADDEDDTHTFAYRYCDLTIPNHMLI